METFKIGDMAHSKRVPEIVGTITDVSAKGSGMVWLTVDGEEYEFHGSELRTGAPPQDKDEFDPEEVKRNRDTHTWQYGFATGTKTCEVCRLYPLDDSDFLEPCPGKFIP